jgi:DNA-binding MarR family transcriptional regulator
MQEVGDSAGGGPDPADPVASPERAGGPAPADPVASPERAGGPAPADPVASPERAGGPAPAGVIRDEVDDLIAAWHSQRPDLDAEPLHVLSRVTRLARHLDRARRAAFAGHGLEPWEFDVLSALRRQGEPFQLSPGALLRATLVTSGTMTNRIDRLEDAGLVRRMADPQDKRGVLVTLTSAGLSSVDAALADLLTSERALLEGLDPDQRQTLAGLLRILLVPLDSG